LRNASRDEGDADRKRNDAPVGDDVDAEGERQRRQHGEQQRGQPSAEHQAGGAADAEQHHRLGQQLTDQSAAGGADREPHRDFAPARRRSREQHPGEIDTGNQQHQADDGHQNGQESAHHRDAAGNDRRRPQRQPAVAERVGILARERLADRADLGSRLVDGHAPPMNSQTARRSVSRSVPPGPPARAVSGTHTSLLSSVVP
jgi:hypothetical protein